MNTTCSNYRPVCGYSHKIVSEAAGQGVPITGDNYINTWDWANSAIFASTIVTTIGYGNVAPKTVSGRIFCILYGLCGIPLCLVWISELGSFFGDRAKRLSQVLIRKGVSVKKVQLICTALFLLWGLLLHLVIPPFVFMSLEKWTYLEGLYFSCITLTTVGFGDYVAGANPNINYHSLYKVFTSLWIYMGLAWLSLFFSWNVHMVVEAHKVLKKKRRQRHKHFLYEQPEPEVRIHNPNARPSIIDIFKFMSEEVEDYSTVIKKIGETQNGKSLSDCKSRSKSCNDILAIETLDHSPRHRRVMSISEVFINKMSGNGAEEKGEMSSLAAKDANQKEEKPSLIHASSGDPKPAECLRTGHEDNAESCSFGPDDGIVIIARPHKNVPEEESAQPQQSTGGTRFKICKVAETELLLDKDEKG
ncbi:potassium channel subfamily K member 5-like isoform X2 [Genypterus blacodes]|uniref:potassium channel subfamily K member 5-like isoform X2 n=1 Tax=Genypterus blacodes TaxID=154954 RepID=UPI003F760608